MGALTQTLFTNGEVLTQAAMNANPNALTAWSTNIDNTNIGSAGLFATNLKPTTGAQATFGGSVSYTFPAGVLATTGGTAGYVSPNYTNTGSVTGSSQKTLSGIVYFASVPAGSTSITVTLSGAAQFSSGSSYYVVATIGPYSGTPNGAIVLSCSSQLLGSFILTVQNSGSITLTTMYVNWIATGT